MDAAAIKYAILYIYWIIVVCIIKFCNIISIDAKLKKQCTNTPHEKYIIYCASGMLLLLLIIIPNTINIKFDVYQWGRLLF